MPVSTVEILLVAVGLAMDAFAVSMCNGLSFPHIKKEQSVSMAFFFGFAQFLMPVIGWLVGKSVADFISSFDHWIAFVLLALIGANMLWDARKKEYAETCEFKYRNILAQAVATSIDALIVGTGLAAVSINIWKASVSIGIITFTLCLIGVYVGRQFGLKFEQKAKILGGLILIGIGTKILIEHLFFNCHTSLYTSL